ncbi:MAG: hypothetical protein V4575_06380 [Pseudomonadota bacterium]
MTFDNNTKKAKFTDYKDEIDLLKKHNVDSIENIFENFNEGTDECNIHRNGVKIDNDGIKQYFDNKDYLKDNFSEYIGEYLDNIIDGKIIFENMNCPHLRIDGKPIELESHDQAQRFDELFSMVQKLDDFETTFDNLIKHEQSEDLYKKLDSELPKQDDFRAQVDRKQLEELHAQITEMKKTVVIPDTYITESKNLLKEPELKSNVVSIAEVKNDMTSETQLTNAATRPIRKLKL